MAHERVARSGLSKCGRPCVYRYLAALWLAVPSPPALATLSLPPQSVRPSAHRGNQSQWNREKIRGHGHENSQLFNASEAAAIFGQSNWKNAKFFDHTSPLSRGCLCMHGGVKVRKEASGGAAAEPDRPTDRPADRPRERASERATDP